ncbi:DUF2269 family protein [Lederbergia wuyishanensis]|uniref:Membrane protein n=1 Tax=Lederbergia wuyishanensis TaxID=1347903 RepID=A0ABU0D5Q9_9BACI|nr:DUF2269 family protein [Lederbergia wuyishanensis]MCJ8008334.1 DUF2269 family protein [Lederbergia wuyishanensis]MDQ0343746.1 putative membrane protein [Lederbergia wuyishanensis]
MFTFLLILHLIAVCCWLGGALYERFFIVGGIRKAKGTELEASMLKLMLSTVPFFLTSVLTILITGIIMTIMHNYIFLSWSWIGLKQYIMLIALLGFFFYIGPRMGKIGKQLNRNLEVGKGLDDEMRSQFNHIIVLFDIMHIGVLINLILGLTKFF